MKKALAIILTIAMLAAMTLVFVGAYTAPPEVATGNEIGVWPMAAGQYDPMLDGNGIKDGTHIYGFYEFDFTTFLITPHEKVPNAIKGYTKVDKAGDMKDGTFCVLTFNAGVDYSYVLVLGDPKAEEPEKPAEPETPAEPAAPTTPEAPAAATATPTKSVVFVDGKEVSFEAYLINDNNYLKLRDLAFAINGSAKNFEVGYDEATKAITLTSGTAYTEVGGEMEGKGAGTKEATPSDSKVTLDGAAFEPVAYFIEGNNYFKLRDIGEALDFNVSFIDGNVVIDTTESYTAD